MHISKLIGRILLIALMAAACAAAAACAGGNVPKDTVPDDTQTAPDGTAADSAVTETAGTTETAEPDTQTETADAAAPAAESDTEPDTEAETLSLADNAARLRTLLGEPDGRCELTVFGGEAPAGADFTALQTEIDALEGSGKMVSFILIDVEDGIGLAYNCDKKWTSQSTIKAPYLTSVLMDDPTVLAREKSLYRAVITVSDNYAYETLRVCYGDKPFKSFCKASGVSMKHTTALYPRSITVRDMAKLWTNMYVYLNTDAPEEYAGWFTGTAFSCIYQGLGDVYRVQTKAGWESGTDFDGPGGKPDARFVDGDPENDEIATNDTGIIYAGNHPYILALFTNLQSDPQSLVPLVRAIDGAHTSLAGE